MSKEVEKCVAQEVTVPGREGPARDEGKRGSELRRKNESGVKGCIPERRG